jgi:hypothetical protein
MLSDGEAIGRLEIRGRARLPTPAPAATRRGEAATLVWRDSARRARSNNAGVLELPRLTVSGPAGTNLVATSTEPQVQDTKTFHAAG